MIDKFAKKQEVEEFLENKGDFIQINHLELYLKKMPPMEMRKFAYLKLAEIYSNKKMHEKEAESYKKAAVNATTFRAKQEIYILESKAYLDAGKLDLSDKALKKALAEGNTREKKLIYENMLETYRGKIREFENQGKKEKSQKLYEKMINMKISEEEREQIRAKLLDLYERLGKTKDAERIRNSK